MSSIKLILEQHIFLSRMKIGSSVAQKGSWSHSSDVSLVHQDTSWLYYLVTQIEKGNVSVINILSYFQSVQII